MSLGCLSPEETRARLLLPDKSDTDMVSCVVSVQYNSDLLHSTANPSQTPTVVMIVTIFDPSTLERLMFCSNTSLQKMYPKL